MKICITCKEKQDLDRFSIDKSKKDGFSSKCKHCITIYKREYCKRNPEKIKKNYMDWDSKNRSKRREYNLTRKRKCVETWRGLIPEETNCQICTKKIIFNSGVSSRSIHFDHRSDGLEPIKGSPTLWLISHPRTTENERIWKECDFGMLCLDCNKMLKTKNRKIYLDNLARYVLNKDSIIQ